VAEAAPAPAPAPRRLQWGAEALWQALAPLLPGLSVEVVARTDSTNTRLLERARGAVRHDDFVVSRPASLGERRAGDGTAAAGGGAHGRRLGDTEPCLLVAEHQTRGRGRLGRDWQAVPGEALTFSLSLPLPPSLPQGAGDLSGLSLAVGVALADALEALDALPRAPGEAGAAAPAPRIGLKWPNDLWLIDTPGRGRKLGGILVETVSVGAQRMVVVGVGLNVTPLAVADAAALTHGHACVREFWPEAQAPAVLHRVALPLVRALLDFQRDGFAGCAAAWARRDLLRGLPVASLDGTGRVSAQGVADGVDDRGALQLRCTRADGSTELLRLVSGEVSVRLRETADPTPAPSAAADTPPPAAAP
jgi:BirA family biotin operon repressor/biotin-[acetyl-CoA-carboxylase] ligase